MNKYEVIYQEDGKKIKKTISSKSKFIEKELLKNIISIKKINSKKVILKDEVVVNILNELNLVISSDINFKDALDILQKSRKDKESLIFFQLIYDLIIEQNDIKKTMQNIKINKSVELFFNLIQKTGEIKSNLNALNTILKEDKKLRSKILNKLSYPLFLFLSFFISFIVIFTFVVPRFRSLINEKNMSIFTESIFLLESFFTNYFYFIVLSGVIFLTFLIFFIRKKEFKVYMDSFLFKVIPFYRYYELYKFFLMLEVFIKNRYEFYLAFEYSSFLIKNKHLLDKISFCNNLLHKGKSIGFSFSKAEIFDNIVINLMNISQQTNSVENIVTDVKSIYKDKFENSFKLFIEAIQPIFLLFMMGLILWIVLGIFLPLWDVNNIINL